MHASLALLSRPMLIAMLALAAPLFHQTALAEQEEVRFTQEVPARPIDEFAWLDYMQAAMSEDTLLQQFKDRGAFPLARALLVLGRLDLIGLDGNRDPFEVSTLETPLGGDFAVDMEEAVGFVQTNRFERTSRFDRPSRFDRVSLFDQPSRAEQRRAEQQRLISARRAPSRFGRL